MKTSAATALPPQQAPMEAEYEMHHHRQGVTGHRVQCTNRRYEVKLPQVPAHVNYIVPVEAT